MQFWRTLFERQTRPYRPQTQVVAVTGPAAVTTTVSQTLLPLQTLTLSSTTYVHGAPSSGTINNATAGTTIVATGLPTGLTINSLLRTWAWDGSGNASTGTFTLYENYSGGTTNPNASVISYSITGGVGQLLFNTTADSGLIVILPL